MIAFLENKCEMINVVKSLSLFIVLIGGQTFIKKNTGNVSFRGSLGSKLGDVSFRCSNVPGTLIDAPF